MKKTILLLLLFAFTAVNAQVTNVSDYAVCAENDPNSAGFFNLTAKNPEILGALDPMQYLITYYATLSDSQSGMNAIQNPDSYGISSNPQTIYVRVVDSVTTDVYYTSFVIRVNALPTANAATLLWCDPVELPIFMLWQATPQISGSQPNVTTTYYLTQSDAENSQNEVDSYMPVGQPLPHVVYARVANSVTGCFRVAPLTLDYCSPVGCVAPTNLNATNITDYSATLNWTSQSSMFAIVVVPFGAPAPTFNMPATVVSQSGFHMNGLLPDTCYSFYVRTICNDGTNNSQWVGPFNFCTHDCANGGQCPDNLKLTAFLDTNNNGIKDAGELIFSNGSFVYEINNSGTPLYGYANTGNFNIFDSNPANMYHLSFVVDSTFTAYYNSAAVYSNVNIAAGSGTNAYNFPVTAIQAFNDLSVHLVPNGNPRPGFTYSNTINYKNNGSATVAAGTIHFTKDMLVSIANISQSGTVDTALGFDYAFTNLVSGEERTIVVTMQVPTIPTVALGQILHNSVAIEPDADDISPGDNVDLLSPIVVGSYDPNDKSEAHGGKVAMDVFTSNDYLTYTIRFENTGSAAAEFMRVEDLLDAALDPDSVVMIKASHACNMRRINNNLIWNFYDINLLPTVINPDLSKGYIQFKVKPRSGFAVGDIIPNAAAIYFDYNPAINTDPFVTEFVQTLGSKSFDASQFVFYPNPAHSSVKISMMDGSQEINKITVYDVLGKSIQSIADIHSKEINVDVSKFRKGIYFVEITTANSSRITKKLIVN